MGGDFGRDLEHSSQLGTGCKSTSKGARCQRRALILKGVKQRTRTTQIPNHVIKPAIAVMFWNQPKTRSVEGQIIGYRGFVEDEIIDLFPDLN